MRRRRVLVVAGGVDPKGGGAGVAAWMLEALRRDHDVTLLTQTRPRFAEVDRYFGTRLTEGGFAVEQAPGIWMPGVGLALLRQHLLFRAARKIVDRFEVAISNESESWIGRPCLQYVHFPWGYLPRPDVELRWFHRLPGALALYRRAALAVSGFDRERMRSNLTLANSAWTAERLRECYDVENVRVLPPPIVSPGEPPPWADRKLGFVVLGRMSPEKRVEVAIDIVARVREAGHAATLAIAGFAGPAAGYVRSLRQQAASRDWISFHEHLDRDQLSALLRAHRYGIHAMVDEHFGMAVAEMVRAGCIVFAHASGGPREILADARLLFEDEADAAQKVIAALDRGQLAAELRQHLCERAAAYSEQQFCDTVRELVAAWPD